EMSNRNADRQTERLPGLHRPSGQRVPEAIIKRACAWQTAIYRNERQHVVATRINQHAAVGVDDRASFLGKPCQGPGELLVLLRRAKLRQRLPDLIAVG